MPPTVLLWLLVPLAVFLVYRRVKSSFVKQPVHSKRLTLRMVLLSALCIYLASKGTTPQGMGAAAGGAILGVALAFVAYRRTMFELEPAGVFYTPDRIIGVAIVTLFFARMAMRMLTVQSAVQPGADPIAAMGQSPLTLGLYFLLAGYYVSYYGAILKRSGEMQAGTFSK